MKHNRFFSSLQSYTFLICLSVSLSPVIAGDTNGIVEYRTPDGTYNHPSHPYLGAIDTPLIRLSGSGYADGYNLPRGVPYEDEGDGNVEVDEQSLVSARKVSNYVHTQGTADMPSIRNLNQLFFQFGQFLSHDTGLSEPDSGVTTGGTTGLSGNESFPIEVHDSDPDFDFPEIPMTRSISIAYDASATGLREQVNLITAFIDGSNVYGSDHVRAVALRSFHGGKLSVQTGPGGPLPPYNTFGLGNANPLNLPDDSLYAAGDIRSNEQIGLIAFHTLFIREHNRLAAEIASNDFPGADLDDPYVDEEIYQRARATVAALLQKITYYEWLPALLGPYAMGDYDGYNPNVDPRISVEFSTAAFRIGHTMLPSKYLVTDDYGSHTPLSLRDAFFNPQYISDNGISDIIRGQAKHRQQTLDRFIVDDVRNFLFGPGFGGLDLASLNIQRGRDHGVPGYNQVRAALGMNPAHDYSDITSDSRAWQALEYAYGSGYVDDVDLWSGALCESPLPGSSLGETFTAIFVDQFTRLRDGDRFYFENTDIYSQEFISCIHRTTLADIICRNTSVGYHQINQYSFYVPGEYPYQPDLRVGRKRNNRTHRGNDLYNLSSAGQRIRIRIPCHSAVKSYASLQNDGSNPSVIRLTTQTPSKRRFRTRFFEFGNRGRYNITADLIRQNYGCELEPSEIINLEANIRMKRHARSNARVRLRSKSLEDYSARDVVTTKLAFR